MKPETEAYYMGRNDANNGKFRGNQIKAELVEHYNQGYRHMKAELNLDDDTEWG
jgi:hypothetical protein